MTDSIDKSEYSNWIKEIKSKIRTARSKVALSINSQLLELYWNIGKDISEKQEKSKWGSNFIERTAIDLKLEFPEMTGFCINSTLQDLNLCHKLWHKFLGGIIV